MPNAAPNRAPDSVLRLPRLLLATAAGLAVVAAGAVPAAAVPPSARPAVGRSAVELAGRLAAPVPGSYVPVTAFRAVDTATGAHRNRRGPLAHGQTFTAAVGGLGGVPRLVGAVVLTLTAVSPTADGGLVAWAAGARRPGPVFLRYSRGRSMSATAIVPLSRGGRLAVYDAAGAGRTGVTVDVTGYYVAGAPAPSTPGVLHTVAPAPALATRILARGASVVIPVGGHDRVPASGVGAVAVLVTALAPARSGALVAYPTGGSRPDIASMAITRGESRTDLALVATDTAGRITLVNTSPGPARVGVDVLGYWVAGFTTAAGSYQPRVPASVLAPRRVAARGTALVTVAGRDGVPLTDASAVAVTVTVAASRPGALVAFAGGTRQPGVVTAQYDVGRSQTMTSVVPLSGRGTIALRNLSRVAVTVSATVAGYVQARTITPPATSTGRYVRTIGDAGDSFADPGTTGDGCVDATAASTMVLLDFGAQTKDGKAVQLTGSGTRVTYPDLVTAIDNYLTGFAACASGARATIALATNNDGDFAAYPGKSRGTAWANLVVDAVAPHPGLTVVGADDIEPLFASRRQEAQDWETGYLDATTAGLIYVGSADGCPATYNQPGGTCAAGWTEKELYGLAHQGTRIQALPQVYDRFQAAQWANIDQTGGGGIIFAGALTEYRACPAPSVGCPEASFAPQQGWTALQHAISTVVAAPSIPAVTDLRADG